MVSPTIPPAARQYLTDLDTALKRTAGTVPADALADAEEFVSAELDRLGPTARDKSDAEIRALLEERFGSPAAVAAAYAAGNPPAWKRPGYAPGWRVECVRCGRSSPASDLGIVRIGAFSIGKWTIAWCRGCRFFSFLRFVKDMPKEG